MTEFHFLRPWLLWLIPFGCLLAWLLWRRRGDLSRWLKLGDSDLIQHLLTGQTGVAKRAPAFLFALLWTALCFALAGPSWQRVEVPVLQTDSSRVIVLDLSLSMLSSDIKPSRLQRAKFLLQDYLQAQGEGTTGLVVFAGDAHSVTPLTDDIENIRNLLPALQTDIMPVQGSRVDLGIDQALLLLQQAGVRRAEILLLADGLSVPVDSIVQKIDSRAIQLRVVAVGTQNAGPVVLADGGFLKDSDGKLVLPATEVGALRRLAIETSGQFYHLQNSPLVLPDQDNRDVSYLMTEQTGDVWLDAGPWLLLFCLPFFLLMFWRGWLFCLLLFLICLAPQPGYAFDWQDLWWRGDQRAQQALIAGDAKGASQMAASDQWRGSALYRAGEFAEAASHYANINTAEGFYNRGNAQAKAGELDAALASYAQALELGPEMEDAKFNHQLLQELKKQQQQQQQNDDGKEGKQQAQSSNESKPGGAGSEQKKASSGNEKGQPEQQQSVASPDSPEKSGNSETENSPAKENQSQDKPTDDSDAAEAAENPEQEASGNKELAAMENDELQAERSAQQQALNQWLRQIPDDPGGLLRRKFLYQYRRSESQSGDQQQW